MRNLPDRIGNLVFPKRCPVCLDIVSTPRGGLICEACRGKLRMIRDPRCLKCGRQLEGREREYCENCGRRRRYFFAGIAGWNYSSVPVSRMIAKVKYEGWRQLLDYPCLEMAQRYRRLIRTWAPDCLVPVPLHPSRRRRRGFNQAEEIARRLAPVWELPVRTDLLFRIRRTIPQKDLGEKDRTRNVYGAFEASLPDGGFRDECGNHRRRGWVIALVDDICTTGSTMDECAAVLLEAGASRVYSIALSAGSDP